LRRLSIEYVSSFIYFWFQGSSGCINPKEGRLCGGEFNQLDMSFIRGLFRR
jgi:hypothetical protein